MALRDNDRETDGLRQNIMAIPLSHQSEMLRGQLSGLLSMSLLIPEKAHQAS
jgi:hypothetical protein